MISELVSRVFQARNVAHVHHWQTKSYAQHMALGAFYDGVIDAIDTIVENYIGMYGSFKPETVADNAIEDISAYLQDEADWIELNRDEISQGSSSIGNLIDNLTSVYTKTVYLLQLK